MVQKIFTSFRIYGLFGTSNVDIQLDGDVQIWIGDNSIGKTQILNIIYYTLSGKFEQLLGFTFDSIEVDLSA